MIDLLNRIGFRQIAFGGEGGGGGGAGRNMVTAPKTRLVQKQPHLLAYITPAEAALLKKNGGTGEMVNGIPAFRPVKGKTSSGKSSAGTGFSGGSSGGGGGGGSSDSRNIPVPAATITMVAMLDQALLTTLVAAMTTTTAMIVSQHLHLHLHL
jgi:hypothetical protein